MAARTAGVILCAGTGSRMGAPANCNKCALALGATTAVRHMTATLLQAGVEAVVVVTGYAAQSIKTALAGLPGPVQPVFIHNPHYAFHGCNYSLACGVTAPALAGVSRLVIAEGDSLLPPLAVRALTSAQEEAVSLVRPAAYIDATRSVIAIGKDGWIHRYAYDTAHTGAPVDLAPGETVLGESLQLWAFSGRDLTALRKLLFLYRREADTEAVPRMESGVYSINALKTRITPVPTPFPECWINLNTAEDAEKAGRVQWLQES